MGQEAQERDTSDARVLSLSAADRSKGKSSPPVPRHCGGAGARWPRASEAFLYLRRIHPYSSSSSSTFTSSPPGPVRLVLSRPPSSWFLFKKQSRPPIADSFEVYIYLCAFSSWLRTRDYRRGDNCVLRLNIKRKFNLRLSCMMALLPGRF